MNSEITALLREWSQGDQEAAERALPQIYRELRSVAERAVRRTGGGHTLQPTALVNEAYIRLRERGAPEWQSRAHFFGVAARLMRQILVDSIRRRASLKRGRDRPTVALDDAGELGSCRAPDLIVLDDALTALAEVDPRKARIVELRYFGGLTLDEAAALLGISPPTVHREWRRARAWLYQELRGEGP